MNTHSDEAQRAIHHAVHAEICNSGASNRFFIAPGAAQFSCTNHAGKNLIAHALRRYRRLLRA